MPDLPYYLGCPIWSKKEWVGNFFSKNARPNDYLRQYASSFNTVEGNTTFYALPKATSVSKWGTDTPPEFRFCFKFPQTISHHLRLQHAEREVAACLNLLTPLAEKLGPFFLQLPASFGGDEFAALADFLKNLPSEFRYAVEVRHADFFRNGEIENDFNALLESLQMGRVVFDTRGLHAVQAPPNDAIMCEAQRKKPKMPVRSLALGNLPFVRFVGNPVIAKNEDLLTEWAQCVIQWLAEGKRPYIFMHAPNDIDAPNVARYFHDVLHKLAPEISALPTWPHAKDLANVQMGLF
ncbi:DUF72 domain-containing protein [candidate division KSB1 bacterium]|nr:DUF72 domain-containing protein [candidate division KSB1 bacterium]